MNELINY